MKNRRKVQKVQKCRMNRKKVQKGRMKNRRKVQKVQKCRINRKKVQKCRMNRKKVQKCRMNRRKVQKVLMSPKTLKKVLMITQSPTLEKANHKIESTARRRISEKKIAEAVITILITMQIAITKTTT